MSDIHGYINAGCVMVGPEIYVEEDDFFGRIQANRKPALRFVIK